MQSVKWDMEDKDTTKAIISKVHVSNCGNFGFIGFNDGKLLKINMQSGYQQTYFQAINTSNLSSKLKSPKKRIHDAPVNGLVSDVCNKFLISTDVEGMIVQWDFYAGTINTCVDVAPRQL